jgi:mono/diheme cytochrome c family protein
MMVRKRQTSKGSIHRAAVRNWQHMKRRLFSRNLLACLTLLPISAGGAFAAANSGSEIDGKAILEKNCSRCHSIEATGASPLKGAPPLREIYLRYPIEQLEYGFAEGMGSKHREMPQIQFSIEEVSAILSYLGSITGVAPSERVPAVIPPNPEGTEPP